MIDHLRVRPKTVQALRSAGCVFAEEEARALTAAAAGDDARLTALVRRRCSGEPLEIVLGYVEFAGVRVELRPGVFVPRPRSVDLVDRAVEIISADCARVPVVVDVGTGSGALALAVLRRAACRMYAIDVDPAAVACARENLGGAGAVVLAGDGFDPLAPDLLGQVDLVLANLPYVPAHQVDLLPREARDHEPRLALDGGADGLDPMRRLLGAARHWLRAGGHYLAEVHVSQLPGVRALGEHWAYRVSAQVDPDDGTTVVDLVETAGGPR